MMHSDFLKRSITFVLFLFVRNVYSARILGVFPLPETSHFILASNLMSGLAEKGHEIVIITPFTTKNIPQNVSYKEVLIEHGASPQTNQLSLAAAAKPKTLYELMYVLKNIGEHAIVKTFEDQNVQKLLNSNEKFDAVIVEQFHMEALKVLSWYFDAQLIVFSTMGANTWLNFLVGNPAPPSYVPELRMAVANGMSFFERLENVKIRLTWEYYNHFILIPSNDKIVKRYFPKAPPLQDIIYNNSLILLNSDISTNAAAPKVPCMIEIGGFHVKPPKTLPEDLRKILDEAKDGAIFFSMGSRLRSTDLPKTTREIFLRVFSKLNMKILWKWEEENLPEKPPNVEIRKWFPQQDILAHPNVKLFITHGGLLSKIETIYHGVPVLSIPVLGDQYMNAEESVAAGFGLRVSFYNITEEYFEESVLNLLNDPKFRENAKRRSKIFHDRPWKPLDTAAFWVEYVIRHKGAPHLRVAALGLNWYQYLLLDVAAFCVIIILLFFLFVVYSSRKILGLLANKGKVKTN